MNPQTLLNKPQVQPKIVPKITKISNLIGSSNEIKKSSSKLLKAFEKGTYQKKTQLTVLNRYKKRLDSIQKQNDKRFTKKQRVKIKLPDIKKYTGSLFTAGSTSDPLKSIAALAAFNAASKLKDGKWIDAIGPGLVAAGLLFGPALLKGGINLARGRGGNTTPTGSKIIGGSPYSQTRAGQAYAGMQAQRNLPKWAQKAAGGSASRFAASNERLIQGTANIGDRARVATGGKFGVGNIAERVATRGGSAAAQTSTRAGGTVAAKAAGVGARAIPLLGTALNIGLSAYRFSQGDVVGGILSAVSAIPIVGWAALGIDLAREFGAFDGTFLGRKDKLKEQTQKQKELVKKDQDQDKGSGLTFKKTLNSYEKSVNKFEEFVKGFKGGMGMGGEQSGVIETGNRGLTTGDTLQDLEATGGEVPGTPDSPFGPRGGREHKGNDYNRPVGTPISIIQPGVVTVADMNYDPSGWGAVVEIRHQDGSISRYAHLSQINVAAGTQVSPGQVIGNVGGVAGAPGSGNSTGAHLHFEYENGSGRIDPTAIAPKIFRFGGNVKVKSATNTQQNISPIFQQPSTENPLGLSIGTGGFNIGGRPVQTQRPAAQITPTPTMQRPTIATYASYDSRSQAGQIIPLPISIPQQQPQMMQQGSSAPMIMGSSEEQVLNSFYKRVLLNTV
jgi:murein DD-endopeptidase MepM/ murein hydrolase activator NlpD